MRKLTILIVILFFSGPGYSAAGQSNLNDRYLEGLIKEAVENNRSIKSLEKKALSLKEGASSAGALPDPVAGIGFANIPTDSFDFNQEPMTQKQIFVAQNVPWLSKLDLKTEIELKKSHTVKSLKKREKALTAKKTASLYYDLIFKEHEIKANKELIRMVENIIQILDSGYSSGNLKQQDILTGHVELERLKDKKISLEKEKNIVEIKLNEVLNRDVFKNIKTKDNLPFPEIKFDSKDFKSKALENNPEIQVLKNVKNEKKEITDLVRKDYYPDMQFKASYGQRGEDAKGNDLADFFSFTASFSIPLWQNKSQDKKLASAKLMEESSDEEINSKRLTLPHKVDEILESLEMKKERYLLFKDSIIPVAEKLSQASMNDYRVGRTEFDTMIRRNMDIVKYSLESEKIKINTYKELIDLFYISGELAEKIE
ncbi:MAG: TolC family protein [Desulfobacteraceae bacterium]|jgi:outer membrane protein TolC